MKFPIKIFKYAGENWCVLNQSRCCRSGKSFNLLFGTAQMDYGNRFICYIESFPSGRIINVSIGSSFISVSDEYFNSLMIYG